MFIGKSKKAEYSRWAVRIHFEKKVCDVANRLTEEEGRAILKKIMDKINSKEKFIEIEHFEDGDREIEYINKDKIISVDMY